VLEVGRLFVLFRRRLGSGSARGSWLFSIRFCSQTDMERFLGSCLGVSGTAGRKTRVLRLVVRFIRPERL
jgi:hypothetical protein